MALYTVSSLTGVVANRVKSDSPIGAIAAVRKMYPTRLNGVILTADECPARATLVWEHRRGGAACVSNVGLHETWKCGDVHIAGDYDQIAWR